MITLADFRRRKEFLICVDSDGCAMDTMDIKHVQCFGPSMVEVWGLERWKEEVLKRWNEINLYTITRGINRFKGLAMALEEINRKYCSIDGIDEFVRWTGEAQELSNSAVKLAWEKAAEGLAYSGGETSFGKALEWSEKVNDGINGLDRDLKKSFAYVRETLAAANMFADVAVVSSANKGAVIEEWMDCGLLGSVDVLCCQEDGSKAFCISVLKEQGYLPEHMLMIGDAPGDLAAAEKNGIYCYPILVRQEELSWKELKETGLLRFQNEVYRDYGEEKKKQFFENLKI